MPLNNKDLPLNRCRNVITE